MLDCGYRQTSNLACEHVISHLGNDIINKDRSRTILFEGPEFNPCVFNPTIFKADEIKEGDESNKITKKRRQFYSRMKSE